MREIAARTRNSGAHTDEDGIHFFPNAANDPLPYHNAQQATRGGVMNMNHNAVNEWLGYYQTPQGGNLNEKRKRLLRTIGVSRIEMI